MTLIDLFELKMTKAEFLAEVTKSGNTLDEFLKYIRTADIDLDLRLALTCFYGMQIEAARQDESILKALKDK